MRGSLSVESLDMLGIASGTTRNHHNVVIAIQQPPGGAYGLEGDCEYTKMHTESIITNAEMVLIETSGAPRWIYSMLIIRSTDPQTTPDGP